jgi:hypothetical protein
MLIIQINLYALFRRFLHEIIPEGSKYWKVNHKLILKGCYVTVVWDYKDIDDITLNLFLVFLLWNMYIWKYNYDSDQKF